ncbi:hypothetical protein [Streptomyces erythrochromogenes]|uniref:hypothetical protein n=1 Tax=Streptomyces erythrochromogenes TaxID=285574 RepID=UPI0036F94429
MDATHFTATETYTGDNSRKIKIGTIASCRVDDTGKIIPGAQYVDGDALIGNARLPQFVVEIKKGIQADCGIPLPDISYTGIDALPARRPDQCRRQVYRPTTRGRRRIPLQVDGRQ